MPSFTAVVSSPKGYLVTSRKQQVHFITLWKVPTLAMNPIRGAQTPVIDSATLRANKVLLFGYNSAAPVGANNFVRLQPQSILGNGSFEQAMQIGTAYIWQGSDGRLRSKVGSPPTSANDGNAIALS